MIFLKRLNSSNAMRRYFALLALFLMISDTLPGSDSSGDAAAWKLVEEAMKAGLPQTAIERLDPIIDVSLASGDHGMAARAIARRIVIESEIEGNDPAVRVRLVGKAISETPEALHPVLQTLRAWWVWQYYQKNRWQFLERTATESAPGDDMEAWDLPRIMAEVAGSFDRALAHAETLQRVPTADYYEFLQLGSLPDKFRPTLYDVIANEALDFFTSAEQVTALSQGAFVLQADSPALDDADAFLAWNPETGDQAAGDYRAVRLYQELMRFHRGDAEQTAFLDVDLARIVWAMGTAAGESTLPRGRAALERFAETNTTHELSAYALHALASTYLEDAPARAHELAMRGAAAHPESHFGKHCLYLAKSIELPTLRVDAGRVWNAAGSDLAATYRNLDHLYFRLIRLEWLNAGRGERYHSPDHLHGDALDAALRIKPAYQWDVAVPETPDFREHTEVLAGPQRVKPGFYLLVASALPDFGKDNNQISTTTVWVSDLALVTRQVDDAIDGFVLHAITGEPIAGAAITLYPHNNVGRLVRTAHATTDKDGHFVLRSSNAQRRNGYVHAEATVEGTKQAIASIGQVLSGYAVSAANDPRQVFFFTDRALYRPGQAVRFKGVAVNSETHVALDGQTLRVEFLDPNGKEIDSLEVVTNDKGSFSGVFTAPTDRVTGKMTLTSNLPTTPGHIHVEEYKRPRFFTEIDAPGETARLGETVRVRGKATTYADTPVDGAQVAWRVTRKVEWPVWYHFFTMAIANDQEIAHGVATTRTDGSFEIEFAALPEPNTNPDGEPVFTFEVRADVTDSAGETRSAERLVRIGYAPLRAFVSVGEWQTPDQPVELTASLASLDGNPHDGEGLLRVFRLREPDHVHRPFLEASSRLGYYEADSKKDLSDPDNWDNAAMVAEFPFRTEDGIAKVWTKLGTGIYRATVEVSGESGRPATARTLVRVIDPAASRLAAPVPFQLVAKSWGAEPGETFTAAWGTGYESGRAFVEFLQDRKVLQKFWTNADATQQLIEMPINEDMRGGISLRITFVRENRAILESRPIIIPWTNKELKLRWERLSSKLLPGATETWTAVVEGPGAEPAAAEMVATLYDASLDQFLTHEWMSGFPVFRRERPPGDGIFQNSLHHLDTYRSSFVIGADMPIITRTQFEPSLTGRHWQGSEMRFKIGAYRGSGSGFMARAGWETNMSQADTMMDAAVPMMMAGEDNPEPAEQADAKAEPGFSTIDPSTVSARTNFEETAFFFPQLTVADDGTVRMEFTMPEALTTWRFLGFAHDAELRAGFLEATAVTSKDLMVQPNAPRFLREGDTVAFTVKITNRSHRRQSGTARLNFFDAETNAPADVALGMASADQPFEVPANASRSLSWRITIPDGCGFLTYRAVAATADISDGEEGWLPVLSRRIFVTESLPLPIRGPATREFELRKLIDSGESDAFESRNLVVQMTSNPAWYAVMALPYLIEFPHECSEQIFHRFYANTLARHIAKSDPKIEEVFAKWRGTDALDSPLAKNEDIKGIALEETPWLCEATSESLARRNVGILFEDGRMNREIARAFNKLVDAQYPDGTWPWFPGGQGDDYITLTIVAGFGRLSHLGVPVELNPAINAVHRLDDWIDEQFRDLKRNFPNHWQDHVLTPMEALYFYARTFFLERAPIPDKSREAVDFYLSRARDAWLRTGSLMSQAHLALALHRLGERETPSAIMASLAERAVRNEEMGMLWKDSGSRWWWQHAPIETQAVMIEAFDEVAGDADAVRELRVWLLKQKQTQDWKTTKATADAVYALLLRGADLLADDHLVEVRVGGTDITPPADDPSTEAGSGMFERRFGPKDIRPEMGRVTVTKHTEGVAWGGIHWQYLADIGHVTPHEGTPLRLKKTIFRRENTARGPVLREISGPLAPGDELVVRIELRTDRDMEYIHLKDGRGSGTEPVNVISGHRHQDGLSYYESTRDTASHFFIDYLPAGTYVFEYPVRVQLCGKYESGIAEVMCMYAPEFNSHSASTSLVVE